MKTDLDTLQLKKGDEIKEVGVYNLQFTSCPLKYGEGGVSTIYAFSSNINFDVEQIEHSFLFDKVKVGEKEHYELGKIELLLGNSIFEIVGCETTIHLEKPNMYNLTFNSYKKLY